MKKTTKVIGAVLSAIMTVSAVSALSMTASASEYTRIENHSKVNCIHRYIENGKAVFEVKALKGAQSVYVNVESKTGGYMDLNNTVALKVNETVTVANAAAAYEGSDDGYDYFKVTVDSENGGVKFLSVNVKAYRDNFADRTKDTDTNDGKTQDGTGYELDF